MTNSQVSTPMPRKHNASMTERRQFLKETIAQYEQLAETEGETAVSLRRSFLEAIRQEPDLLTEEAFSSFMGQSLTKEDFLALEWTGPHDMILFSESLYLSRFEDKELTKQLNQFASLLLRRALRQCEKEGDMEEMFKLLRLAPSYLLDRDEELSRLYYRANAYEVRRVRRSRRFLYGYLLVQVLLILFVFPFLFINAENGRLQREVEELADVELGDEGYQLISYSEGVYWAVITAASIGYGDITPTTGIGRFIAGTLGTMGVITIGILAGLVLDWITPRHI
ncbi:MAG: potassium channel family protein [Chloroflexota bacterium]